MNSDVGLLLLRVVAGLVVMAHGAQKLGLLGGQGPEGTQKMIEKTGVRPTALWATVVTMTEFAGGALLALGLGGPLPGVAIAGNLAVAIVLVHLQKGFWNMKGGLEFPLVLGSGALAIAMTGPGWWALDRVLRLTYDESLVVIWSILVVAGVVLALASRGLGEQGAVDMRGARGI